MNRRILILLLGICFLFSGCRGKQPVRQGVVCRITVTAPGQAKEFTSQGKMVQILDALRNLGQRTTAQLDLNFQQDSAWRIAVEKTDGTVTAYTLQGECYIRKNDNPWQQMDARRHLELRELLTDLPGDG